MESIWNVLAGIKQDIEHIFQKGDTPKPGDMIQFQMVLPFQHWGIYIGNGEIVHFAYSFSDIFPYEVRREKIKDVLGAVKSAVWNKFDHKYPPLDPTHVVKRALHMVNKVLRFNFVTANCEHFATLMRYNKALSDQVGSPVLRSVFFSSIGFFSPFPSRKHNKSQALFGAFASIFAYL
ncbi:phospholipase A and acyltransferase 4-like [Crotalus tigris]|uniref:phospholipase A and acyltransferase 4-like n=1 Tax=Crotalus tigris TaxID=88082 RepID=UPI00192F201E|nr:phospholipase A and acyltransferase 4-like [Crotalus tigris]